MLPYIGELQGKSGYNFFLCARHSACKCTSFCLKPTSSSSSFALNIPVDIDNYSVSVNWKLKVAPICAEVFELLGSLSCCSSARWVRNSVLKGEGVKSS